jgi:hypothetical protein
MTLRGLDVAERKMQYLCPFIPYAAPFLTLENSFE